jgi:hypothetical protein
MTGFETHAEAVDAHGKFLSETLASDLQQAVDASHVSLGADVMGVICQVYSFVFNEELDQAKDLVSKLPGAMESTGGELRATAATYRDTDEGQGSAFGGLYA